MAEAHGLNPLKCGFESHRGYRKNQDRKKAPQMEKYRIVKNTVDGERIWVLLECSENDPWIAIDEDTDRTRLERYKAKLDSGAL